MRKLFTAAELALIAGRAVQALKIMHPEVCCMVLTWDKDDRNVVHAALNANILSKPQAIHVLRESADSMERESTPAELSKA